MVQYDEKLNEEIKRTFRNFNLKVKRNKTKTRGRGMLPLKVNVKEWKDRYSDKSKAEIMRQLKLYQSFGDRFALEKASDSSRISRWELDYFISNYDKTLDFFNREIKDLERILKNKPPYELAMHNRYNQLKNERKFLKRDLTTLSEGDIKTMRGIYEYAERSELVKRQGFRLYLTQLDRLLSIRGVPKQQKEELISKFDVLSENEFLEMMRNENIIDRIYDLVYSPEERGVYELTTDDENADEIIRELWSQADSLILKYKKS